MSQVTADKPNNTQVNARRKCSCSCGLLDDKPTASKTTTTNRSCRMSKRRSEVMNNWPVVYYRAASFLVTMILLSTNDRPTASVQCQEIRATKAVSAAETASELASRAPIAAAATAPGTTGLSDAGDAHKVGLQQDAREQSGRARRSGSSSALAPSMALLMPINELRVSGTKNEPPSRPTVDWSKQRPYFGNLEHNVSVELGRTARLTCKVFELGDKAVSWLKPSENEILTTGRYSFNGDHRFTSINDNGGPDWILEIKDVKLNDSTSYECQISTDPKMSAIINLQVKAAKARIKQGEHFYAPLGSNIEFTCEIGQQKSASSSYSPPAASVQQTYWYFNGNLLNYARIHAVDKNFSIDWDSVTQTSRFKLHNVQLSDAGNYTCKPTSSEPSTIRLYVKKSNKNGQRTHYNNGYHSANTKEAQRNRHYGLNSGSNGLELMDSSGAIRLNPTLVWAAILMISCLITLLYNHHPPRC